jgi:two-component sensor histidine kinase
MMALSAAHDVLLQQNWTSASVSNIVDSAICTFGNIGRFDISGTEVRLGSRATLSLSLLLHELTTNALKYGALSNDKGRVTIAWRVEDSDNGANFRLHWREQGGPDVAAPTRKGFGSRLLNMGLAGTGGAKLHYHRSGLEADFAASLAELHT